MAHMGGLLLLIIFWALCSPASIHSEWQTQGLVEAQALGHAITASKKMEAIHKNPAIAAHHWVKTLQTTNVQLYEGMATLYSFRYHQPLTKTLALSVFTPIKVISGLEETIQNNENKGEIRQHFSDTETHLELTLAKQLSTLPLSLGISAAYQKHTLHTQRSEGYTLDLGGLYNHHDTTIGFSIKNILSNKEWDYGRKEKENMHINTGISKALSDRATLYTDIQFKDEKIKAFSGLEAAINQHLTMQFGVADIAGKRQLSSGVVLDIFKCRISISLSESTDLGASQKVGFQYEL
jgi:hypothetical protein